MQKSKNYVKYGGKSTKKCNNNTRKYNKHIINTKNN